MKISSHNKSQVLRFKFDSLILTWQTLKNYSLFDMARLFTFLPDIRADRKLKMSENKEILQ